MAKDQKTQAFILELAALAAAANFNQKKVPELREFIAKHEDLFASANFLLNMPHNTLIMKLSGSKEGTRAIYLREVEALKQNLSSPDDTPLESLMIDRIVACYLRVSLAELLLSFDNISYVQSAFLDKELTRANARFLRACDSLARVRVLIEAHRAIKAKADMLDAKAATARINSSNASIRLLKAATS